MNVFSDIVLLGLQIVSLESHVEWRERERARTRGGGGGGGEVVVIYSQVQSYRQQNPVLSEHHLM